MVNKKVINSVFTSVLYLVLAFFSYLLFCITWKYVHFPLRSDVAFLVLKQEYIHLWYYKTAFYTHVFTSMFVLLAGFTQFSTYILTRYKNIHRAIGYTYVSVILLFTGPSGLLMGYYANGGYISQLAFCILAILWLFFTYKAYTKAIQKEFSAHKKYMYYSYALTLSAITLRAWKWGIVQLFAPSPMDVYQLVAWLGWVPNILIATLYIHYKEKIKNKQNKE